MGRPLAADALVQQLVGLFAELPQVEAITLGGSRASGWADAASDFDLYVLTSAEVPLETRRGIVQRLGGAFSANLEMGFYDDA